MVILSLALLWADTLLAFPAFIGHGYDSLRLEVKPDHCMAGEVRTTKENEALVLFNRVENFQNAGSNFHFSTPGAIYLKADTEVGKFVIRARDSRLSSTYLLQSRVLAEREVLANPQVREHENGFRESCGNQYVSSISRGGQLYVGIKFLFASSRDKSAFDSGGMVSSIGALSSRINTLSRETKSKSSVEIFFHQLGGEVSELDEIFTNFDIFSCSLENYKKCEALIENLWAYGTDRFPKTVSHGKSQPIDFQATDYPDRPREHENPEILRLRRKLLDALEDHMFDRDYLGAGSISGLRWIGCEGRCEALLTLQINANIRDIQAAVKQSFLDPEGFLEHGHLGVLGLHPYKLPRAAEIGARRRVMMMYLPYLAVVGTVLPAMFMALNYGGYLSGPRI